MRRGADAKRFDQYLEQTLRPLADRSMMQAEPLDRFAGQTAAFGVFAAMPILSFYEVVRYCKAADEPARRDVCSRLAALMVEKDSTLLGLRIGRSIGAAVGWPAERVAALSLQDRDAP